jgi:hypothetical protein
MRVRGCSARLIEARRESGSIATKEGVANGCPHDHNPQEDRRA